MFKALCIAIGSLLIATQALAQGAVSLESANPAPKPKLTGDPNRIVCERVERIGSRLTADKVCMTVQQWADHKDGHRADLEKIQQIVNQNPSR
jgi:hypothetical protein